MNQISRTDAETKILSLLEEIRRTYYRYNPRGGSLTIYCNRNFLEASNAFYLGGEDHEYPICVRVVNEQ